MSNAKHTPGPYIQRGAHILTAKARQSHDLEYGSKIGQAVGPENDPETLANAALWTAAPELLEALVWCKEIADKNYEQDEKLRAQSARTLVRISERCEAAIAKAEGGDA